MNIHKSEIIIICHSHQNQIHFYVTLTQTFEDQMKEDLSKGKFLNIFDHSLNKILEKLEFFPSTRLNVKRILIQKSLARH